MGGQQLPLVYGGEYEVAEDWDHLRRLLVEVVDALGRKAVACDLGINVADLSNALAGRDRHPVKAEWMPYLLRRAPHPALLQYLADLAGYRIERVEALTPAQKLERLEAELARRYTEDERSRLFESAYGRPARAAAPARARR